MKKTITLLFIIMLMLLTPGCMSGKHYVYSGDSDSWIGNIDAVERQYVLDGKTNIGSSGYLYLTYKGDISELSSVKHFKLVCDVGSQQSSAEDTYSEDSSYHEQTYKLNVSGFESLNQDDNVTVTVTVDGKTESFEMKSQS